MRLFGYIGVCSLVMSVTLPERQAVNAFVAPNRNAVKSPFLQPRQIEIRLESSHSDTDINSSSSCNCPFSKVFPRYRIDLTRSKRKSKEQWFPFKFESPFKGITDSFSKGKFESILDTNEVLVWKPNLGGVAALSELWSQAANLLVDARPSSNSVLVGLPDTSPTLVQNFVEILDWMGTVPDVVGDGTLGIQASLVPIEDGFAAIRMQRTSHQQSMLDPSNDPSSTSETINQRTKAWVKRLLVEQGICPFTKSVPKSGQGLADVGVPVGSIAYHASSASQIIPLLADTWKAIDAMLEAGPSGKEGVSSILLAAPSFDNDFDLWAGPIFSVLEASVVAAQAEAQVGVVCFHPQYACPDGSSWPGFGHMHSVPRLQQWYQEQREDSLDADTIAAGGAWQRRTPHATINVLRADQLEAAESRRTSGELYPRNIDTLVGSNGIGSEQLAMDLERERNLN